MSTLGWWWSPHPSWEPGEDWDENVPVVGIESNDEVVLIDPFLPPDGSFAHLRSAVTETRGG